MKNTNEKVLKLDAEMERCFSDFYILKKEIRGASKLLKDTMVTKKERSRRINKHRDMFNEIQRVDTRIVEILEELNCIYENEFDKECGV